MNYRKGERPEIGRRTPTRPRSANCHKAFYMPVAAVRELAWGHRRRSRTRSLRLFIVHRKIIQGCGIVARPACLLGGEIWRIGQRFRPIRRQGRRCPKLRIKPASVLGSPHTCGRSERATFASAQALIIPKLPHSKQNEICLRIKQNVNSFSSDCIREGTNDIEIGNHSGMSRAHHQCNQRLDERRDQNVE